MTDKLAEEIARKQISLYLKGRKDNPTNELFNRFIKAMQAYHEAKMQKEKIVESFERENQYLTDEDIQAWALKRVIIDMQPKSRINTASENAYKRGLIEAATAMRDGEIKHVSRDNDR